MKYADFLKLMDDSKEDICRQVYEENRETIRIKKEKTAVKNFEKIFDAVFKITYQKGFQAMSMRDLSAETGLSMGALYAYFQSKEELLTIIQKQGRAMLQKVFDTFGNEEDSPEERLRELILAHLYLSEQARPWFYFTFMEVKHLAKSEQEQVFSLESYTESVLIDVLTQGERQGIFKPGNHALTASIIKAMQQDWYLKRWKYTGRNISVDDFAEHVIAMVEAFCLKEPK